MKGLKILGIVIVVLLVILTGVTIVIDNAGERGYREGHAQGYKVGEEGIGADYLVRNPTYKELLDFLARDKTDLKPGIEGEYGGEHFSAEVNNNAELEGIRVALVIIDYPQPPGHAIVAFETIDKGLIFIEPQLDKEVKLEIGKRYFELIGYPLQPRDDTITKITIIW